MRRLHTAALAALACACLPAAADELVLHTFSLHSEGNTSETHTSKALMPDGSTVESIWQTKAFNNVNLGLGYRWDNGWEVGAYRNSFRQPSVYAFRGFEVTEHVRVFAGGATGYRNLQRFPITPMCGALLRAPLTESVALELALMPPVGKHVGIAHLVLAVRLP